LRLPSAVIHFIFWSSKNLEKVVSFDLLKS
jgi:hypothetical protein